MTTVYAECSLLVLKPGLVALAISVWLVSCFRCCRSTTPETAAADAADDEREDGDKKAEDKSAYADADYLSDGEVYK